MQRHGPRGGERPRDLLPTPRGARPALAHGATATREAVVHGKVPRGGEGPRDERGLVEAPVGHSRRCEGHGHEHRAVGGARHGARDEAGERVRHGTAAGVLEGAHGLGHRGVIPHRLARDVDAALDSFDTQRAGRLIAQFVDDLSNWYVRRSRRRFWDGDVAALATLDEALRIVTLVMAPFTPFVTERVWQDMVRPVDPHAPTSVHLASWPEPDPDVIDDELAAQVGLVRRVVELGRAARAASSVRTRQPLSRALVSASGWAALPADLVGEVASELNVLDVTGLSSGQGDLVDVSAKANFRSLGKRFGKQTPSVAQAIADADAAALAAGLRDGSARVDVPGLGEIEVAAEDVVVTETPREGWSVASGEGETVALDLELTAELRSLGAAREAVRLIQEGRKNAGLDISDRIALRWSTSSPDVAAAMREHADLIAGEVLATAYEEGPPEPDAHVGTDIDLPLEFSLRRA